MEMIELLNSINIGFLLYKNDLLLVYIPYKFIWSGFKKNISECISCKDLRNKRGRASVSRMKSSTEVFPREEESNLFYWFHTRKVIILLKLFLWLRSYKRYMLIQILKRKM